METIAKWIIALAVAAVVIALLPNSFVQTMLNNVSNVPYLAQINWLIPIHTLYAVSLAWLTAIGLYYLVSWILRELGILD